jgi:hypothetical protein
MTADVVEPPELLVGAANDDERFADQPGGEVVSGVGDLVMVSDHLPGAGEDLLILQDGDGRIAIKKGGKSRGTGDVGIDVEGMEWAHVGRCFEATHCKAGTAFGVWCSVFGVFGFDHPKGGGQEWTNFLRAVEVVSIS